MRLMHLSDLHLGRTIGDYSMIEDQRYMLEKVVKLALDKKVDGILVAGDVYDKNIPSEEAVKLFDEFLCSVSNSGIKAFIISGNHDSDDRLGFGSKLFKANNIFIETHYNGSLRKEVLEDEYGKVNIYLLPFVKNSLVKHYHEDADIWGYDDAVRTVIEKANIDKSERNVIISHQYVYGTSDLVLSGSEGFGPKYLGYVEKIAYDAYEDFDYVALGHVHKAQRLGREEVRYSGSLLKYSRSEARDKKSIPIVTLGNKGYVNIELCSIKPLRDVQHIKGKMAKILGDEGKNIILNNDDYMYFTLTDEEVVNDVMSIFQTHFPRTVKIDYENSHTREMAAVDYEKVMKKRSFELIVSEFYKAIYGIDISAEELTLMKEVARRAGVKGEA